MIEFIQSASEDELKFIANLDYGNDAEKHYAALRKVIFEQNCVANADQYWHPAEVYELGSNSLQENHQREFTICTLLVINNVIAGIDISTDLKYKFNNHTQDYEKLTKELKNIILLAYEKSNI